ncbi:phage portal protein [Shigella sonnei]
MQRTIESELDTEKAFEYIAGAPAGAEKDNPLLIFWRSSPAGMTMQNVTLGGVKIVTFSWRLSKLTIILRRIQTMDFLRLEQALLRYIAAGLAFPDEQLSRDYSKVSYSSAGASANESWRYFMGRRKFIAALVG